MGCDPISNDSHTRNKRVLVIGLGNSDRTDDGVGLVIARQLKTMAPDWMSVCESSGDLTALLDVWKDFDEVVLIDALHAGGVPGRVRWFDVSSSDLPGEPFAGHSTHAFGISQAIAIARALGELPREIHVVGVQGANFETGVTLSAAVGNAVEGIVTSVLGRCSVQRHAHA